MRAAATIDGSLLGPRGDEALPVVVLIALAVGC